MTPLINNPLTNITITAKEVEKKLAKLRTDKSCGPDGVHPLILNKLSGTLAEPLAHIFQLSLSTGEVPLIWKHGTITAIFKKGRKSFPSNYRGVTLTSVVCKLLESIITEHIKNHLIANNVQDKGQHGFTKNKSTVTNLIEALNIWTEALSHGLPVDLSTLILRRHSIKFHTNAFSTNYLDMASEEAFSHGSEIICIKEPSRLE